MEESFCKVKWLISRHMLVLNGHFMENVGPNSVFQTYESAAELVNGAVSCFVELLKKRKQKRGKHIRLHCLWFHGGFGHAFASPDKLVKLRKKQVDPNMEKYLCLQLVLQPMAYSRI